MKSTRRNNWHQPAVPTQIVPPVLAQVVIETLTDLRTALTDKPAGARPHLWSPPGAAGMHGVLWFVSLQQAALEQFPDQQPVITLDCGDRADLAHAALREGLRSICFRGSPVMLTKLRAIADTLGAVIEIRHPALPD